MKKKYLDPDEIFADAINLPSFSENTPEGRMEKPLTRGPFFLFALGIAGGLAVLAVFLFRAQILRGAEYRVRADDNKFYEIPLRPPRGVMYDSRGVILASNESTFGVYVEGGELPEDAASRELIFSHLAKIIGNNVSADVIAEEFVKTHTVLVASDLSRETALEILARQDELPGVFVQEEFSRRYPFSASVSHVLGYVGRVTREETSGVRGFSLTDVVGRDGIEAQYDSDLRGGEGRKLIEVNAKGSFERDRLLEPPRVGLNAELAIDAELQKAAFEIFSRLAAGGGAKAGAVVALDPRDGAVRALFSYPSFDNNMFTVAPDNAKIRSILSDPRFPLLNRAISSTYPSGSTIKPIIATAALEEGVIDEKRKILDEGFISIPDPYHPGQATIFRGVRPLGWVDLRRAIANSSNIYFYTVGGGYKDIVGLGVTRIKQYANRLGLGTKLGIDLPGEAAGFMPDPEWKKEHVKNDPLWRLGDTYNTSIGQGYVNVTPLQLTAAISAIANGGTLWKPRVLTALLDERKDVVRETAPEAIRSNVVSSETLRIVREGMRLSVTDGLAVSLSDLPVTSAAKSGTAEIGEKNKTHAWFTVFAPYENPEIVLTVFVEKGGGGSVVALPVAKEILRWYAENRYQKTSNTQ
ncbi:MAG: penicillin-binding protein 2 [bacterium]|nr:penicillin-binding protein 2 [bacterium]